MEFLKCFYDDPVTQGASTIYDHLGRAVWVENGKAVLGIYHRDPLNLYPLTAEELEALAEEIITMYGDPAADPRYSARHIHRDGFHNLLLMKVSSEVPLSLREFRDSMIAKLIISVDACIAQQEKDMPGVQPTSFVSEVRMNFEAENSLVWSCPKLDFTQPLDTQLTRHEVSKTAPLLYKEVVRQRALIALEKQIDDQKRALRQSLESSAAETTADLARPGTEPSE